MEKHVIEKAGFAYWAVFEINGNRPVNVSHYIEGEGCVGEEDMSRKEARDLYKEMCTNGGYRPYKKDA